MDAVSGRKEQMPSGSAPDRTFFQPCAEDGKKILPEAFCPVCEEFLCFTCARVHRNQKITKSHALQDKSSMPSSFREESEDEKFKETCQRHGIEFIKYYCLNHEELLCGDCLAEKAHRSCNIERISQLAERYKEGEEYNNLKTGLVQTANDIGRLSPDIQAIMKSVDEECLTNINELRKFRTEINQYLDKWENELLAEIDQKKRTSNTLLNELKSKCTNMKSSIEKLKSELQEQDDNTNQLFIVGKRAIKELAGLQEALEDVSRRSEVPRYKFQWDQATEQLIASDNAIGTLEEGKSSSALGQHQRPQQTNQEQPQQETTQQHQKQIKALSQTAHFKGSADLSLTKFIRQPDISVKTLGETRNCYLTSVAHLTGDRLLLVDCANYSLKLVDTMNNKLVSQVKLPVLPWDLCLLPGDRAAVALPGVEKIQFVSTRGIITLQEVVKVDGYCHGIEFCENNLIVSFSSPGKFVLMDMKGNVKKSVDKDSNGKPLFMHPEYLTMTIESQTPVIYSSDWGINTITKLSISLEVLKNFKHPILSSPSGLASVGDNQLLVSGRDSNNILVLDTLTCEITQLLGKEEGIESPLSVAYCPQKKMMFVTCSRYGRPELENFVKVFKVT
ncbi:uncharacterized protein LOC128216348 [Mya arenaria]|uniref:uncharacterized protein LOC128216348 n=1 Tax=Mya arenaria TaxID=6604 RepID=UPI0022E0891A|nr:uncharacterized protein LOC128216348 [Mya arenaria]